MLEKIKGYRTIITTVAVVVVAAGSMFGVNVGMTPEQIANAIFGLVAVATAFLRLGVDSPGWKTLATSAVTALFAFSRSLGLDLGMDETQFLAAIGGLYGLIIAFLRLGVKKAG